MVLEDLKPKGRLTCSVADQQEGEEEVPRNKVDSHKKRASR